MKPKRGSERSGAEPEAVRASRLFWIVVPAAALVYFALALASQFQASPVRDEPVHFTFGRELLERGAGATPNRGVGSFSLLNALPEQVSGLRLDSRSGRTLARLPTILTGTLLVASIGLVAGRFYGPRAAALAAGLAAFEPNLLAHGQLVTVDLPVAAGIFWTLAAVWELVRRPSTFRLLLAGLAFGLALTAKATALILVGLAPAAALLARWSLADPSSPPAVAGGSGAVRSGGRTWRAWLAGAALVGAIALAVLWASYLFQGLMEPLGGYALHSRMGRLVQTALPGWLPVPLPRAFVRSLDLSFWTGDVGHPGLPYLCGEFRPGGFRLYYLAALALKSTVGFLMLTAAALVLLVLRPPRPAAGELVLWLPVVVLLGYFSLFDPVNIGLRYILPIYPFLCVAAGRLASLPRRTGASVLGALVVAAAGLHLAESLANTPHQLAFFNFACGGPARGHEYLIDSNLDWGQDREALQEYVAASPVPVIVNPIRPVKGRVAVNANRLVLGKFAWLRDEELVERVARSWFVFDSAEGAELADDPGAVPARPRHRTEMVHGPRFEDPPPGGRPNLLLVTIDTLRADHLSLYGHRPPTSPVLDALARTGAVFTQTRSPIPHTTPAHASLLTGLYPAVHGSTENCQPIRPPIETLAQRLAAAGYDTGAVVSSSVLAARVSGLSAGFGRYVDGGMDPAPAAVPDPTDPGRSAPDETTREETAGGGSSPAAGARAAPGPAPPPHARDALLFSGGRGANVKEAAPYKRTADQATDLALDWLGARSTPFFLWVHYFDPHSDYSPPAPYAALLADYFAPIGSPLDVRRRRNHGQPIDLARHNAFHAQYDGEIRFTDAQFARLLRGLAARGQLDRTLIVVVADHGETLGEYAGYVGHGEHLNEGSMHIPLLIREPGRTEGRLIEAPVETVDLMPTMLELLGLAVPSGLDGTSLAPLLRGRPGRPDRPQFMQTAVQKPDTEPQMQLAIHRSGLKYGARCRIEELSDYEMAELLDHPQLLEGLYLRDLDRNPDESRDYRGELAEEASAMQLDLAGWLARWPARPGAAEMDEETLRMLESLGYVR